MSIQSENGKMIQTAAGAFTREMYMVHTIFRREFGLMPGLVRSVEDGDNERILIVAEHIILITSLLHHHHHAEDKHLWPRLLERGSGEVAPIVELMESQHENIDRASKAVEGALLQWRSGEASKQALIDAILGIVPMLDEHMAVEESRILPLVEQYITPDEWSTMVENAIGDIPKEDQPLIFGMAMYEGDPEAVQSALSRLPAQAQPVVKQLAAKAFAFHSERLYGTATPPRVAEIWHRSAS